MNTVHNPIAVLVSQIQNKWNQEVHPFKTYRLVRWVIRPQEARLYEGFLKLESTQHGSIPEVLVVMLTPFTDKQSFSKNVIYNWIEQYKTDREKQQQSNETAAAFNWDFTGFEKQLQLQDISYDKLLMEMFVSFQRSFDAPQTRLAIAFMPRTVSSPDGYRAWLDQRLAEGIPEQVMLVVFDDDEALHFDGLSEKYKGAVKDLALKIDLEGAVGKLAKTGDPNSPEVQFRVCMQEMGTALTARNLLLLNQWGKRGLEIAQKTGQKSFFAAAHLIYAGMLFNFKKFEEINQLLKNAFTLAQAGLKAGDNTCRSLIIQCYAYQAACCQHEGKELEAAGLFVKQGTAAIEYDFGLQALTAWWQAYSLYQKKDEQLYIDLLEKTYVYGTTLPKEQLASSCIGYIAFDYHAYLTNLKQVEKCRAIDDFMKTIEGENWKAVVEKYKADTKRKKRFLFI